MFLRAKEVIIILEEEIDVMKTSEILKSIRIKNNLTQDEMAEKLLVTRQAISRWENGETEPNIESLKLLSTIFNSLLFVKLSETTALHLHNSKRLPMVSGSSVIFWVYDFFLKPQRR